VSLSRIIPLVLLLLAAACTRPEMPVSDQTPQIVGVREVVVSGVTYKVSRRGEQQNRFRVTTGGGRRGNMRGAATAVQRAHGCQRVQLTEVEGNWRVADAIGSFCSTRNWQPSR